MKAYHGEKLAPQHHFTQEKVGNFTFW